MRPPTMRVRAEQFIGSCARQVADHDGRLPTIRELAVLAGVSPGTMRKAVAAFREQGLLSVRPGRGIRLTQQEPTASPAPRPSHREPAWQAVRAAMAADLHAKRFGPGATLPHAKVLAVRYGCCHRTLTRAVDSILASGLLKRENRRLVQCMHHATVSHNTIVVVVRGTGAGSPVPIGTWSPRNRQQFEALEQCAAETGCRLEVAIYRYESAGLVGPDNARFLPPRVAERTDILGFMVWSQGLGDLDVVGYVRDLERYGKPIAVLDVGGAGEFSPLMRDRGCRVFGLGVDERCGERVASHLLSLGHQSVDYIGTTPFAPRVVGLRRTFGNAGLADALSVFDVAGDVRSTEREEMEERFGGVLDMLARQGPAARDLRDYFAQDQERLVDKALQFARLDSVRPGITAALRAGSATAIVCENDALALHCLRVLRVLGLRVPEDRSVVGFDDEEEAFLSGLSSYNFNVRAVVGAMVDYVLRPASAMPKHPDVPVTVDGHVRWRATTSPPGEPRQLAL